MHFVDFLASFLFIGGVVDVSKRCSGCSLADHQTLTIIFFFCSFDLEGVLMVHLTPLTKWNVVDCFVESIFGSMSQQIEKNIQFSLCAKEAHTALRNGEFFDYRLSPSQLTCRAFCCPTCCQCRTTVEWSTFSFCAVCRVASHGTAPILDPYFVTINRWRALLVFKALVPARKILQPNWAGRSLSVCPPNLWLTMWAVSVVLFPQSTHKIKPLNFAL